MSKKRFVLTVLVAFLISLPVASFAAEHGGTAMEKSAAPATETTSESAPEAPAAPEATPAPEVPVAPPEPAPVTPPALKPITITFSGDLSAVNTTETPPMITVQDRYGVKKEISVPAETKISQGGASKALSDLKAGDKLTVEYTYDVATGKRTAQAISLGEAAPSNS